MKDYNYQDCPVIATLDRSAEPLVSTVPVDDMTNLAQSAFDFYFDGTSTFYPFLVPDCLKDVKFNKLVITGASGTGKSTFLKTFQSIPVKEYDCSKAVISNFTNKEDAVDNLGAAGLNCIPTWCKPRNVLSVGEGFRADVALNLFSGACFDEFTSTVDRNVAISLAVSIGKHIARKKLENMVFCSCHKDYIDYLNPDYVVDLDEACVYDCRGINTSVIRKTTEYNFFEGKKIVGSIVM